MNAGKTAPRGEIYLGRYEALRQIGRGGMGTVFLGRQLDQPRPVVIKVMHPEIADNPRFRQNFAREIRLMASFQHPHAVTLFDASVDDPVKPCIIMEYVPGISVADLLQRHRRLTPHHVGRLLAQLCKVLQAAHDAGILHRDLTPHNLMVMHPCTPQETLKVLDFGLARMGAAPYIALEKLTGSGDSIGGGTPDYLCPEQIRREEVDHRGDLYSVGVLLFQMLSGRLPFDAGTDVADILLAHLDKPPLTFAAAGVGPLVTPDIEEVVQACLMKYPRERPQCARDLAKRFEKALGKKLLTDSEADKPAVQLPPTPRNHDRPHIKAHELMDCLEAWMPEQIAVVKLRGFVSDLGGEVIESEPGLIRVRLPGPEEAATEAPPQGGLMGWFGLGTRVKVLPTVLMELHLEKKLANGRNQLQITVAMRPEQDEHLGHQPTWRPWCQGICRDLRAYLISG